MPGFRSIGDPELADAAWLIGLSPAAFKKTFVPLPVSVDGRRTIALCIKANPPGQPQRTILHPLAIVPHRKMFIQDIRGEVPREIQRVEVHPIDARHARVMQGALDDPEAFLSVYWNRS